MLHKLPLKVHKIVTNLEVGFIKKGLNYEVKSLVLRRYRAHEHIGEYSIFSNNEILTSVTLYHWIFVGTGQLGLKNWGLINENIDSMNMTEIGHNPKDF